MGSPEPPRRYRHSHDAAFMAGYDTPPEFTPDEPVPPDGTQWTADEWLAALDAVVTQRDEALERGNQLEKALRELSGYVRAHLAGQDADPELRWALDLADEALSAAGEDAK